MVCSEIISDIQDVYVSTYTDVEKSEVISENIPPDKISFDVLENNFHVSLYDNSENVIVCAENQREVDDFSTAPIHVVAAAVCGWVHCVAVVCQATAPG